jgi:tetratricopeptide (TPR) repeat protein
LYKEKGNATLGHGYQGGRAAADVHAAEHEQPHFGGQRRGLDEDIVDVLGPAPGGLKDTSFGMSPGHPAGSPMKPSPPSTSFGRGQSNPGKNAPARVKANPALKAEETMRPNSRSMPRLEPMPQQVVDTTKAGWLANLSMDFEQQLQEIERLNLANTNTAFALGLKSSESEESSVTDPPPAEGTLPKETADANRIGRPIHVPYTPDLRARPTLATSIHTHVAVKPMVMRDYQLLAEACQRAGKARMEGHAYYKQGELLAVNKETLPQSAKYFKKYLNICRRLNDLQGEAKALNCIGIAHQEIGGTEHLQHALEYHRQHSEISDAAGIFIANTNMGLIYGQLDNWSRAIEHHKQALQYAVRAGDRQAESLALANLGLMGRSQGDLNTAKVCMERHLELAHTLSDETAAVQANEQLGLLAVEKGEWNEAAKLLTQAMDLSSRQNDQRKSNELKGLIGVVTGNLKMEEHIRTLARNMGAKVEKKARKTAQEDPAH